MNVSKSLVIAASSALGLLFVGAAQGVTTYTYVTAPGQQTYNVAAGAQITLDVYLNENVSGVGASSILAPNVENGLAGAGFSISRVSNGLAAPSAISGLAFNADAASNQFNGGTSFNLKSASSPSFDQLSESTFNDPSGVGVELGNGNTLDSTPTPSNDIFLGTITLTAGTSPGTTLFNLGAGTGNFAGNTVTEANVLDLDQPGTTAGNTGNDGNPEAVQAYIGVGNQVSQISVTVTPEPASIGLLGIASLGLLSRRRRQA